MKKILFIINTEGHLLTAASLIFERFNNTLGYQPFVLQLEKTGTVRFQNEVKKEMLTDFYFEIDSKEIDIKNKLSSILYINFEMVFVFLEQLSLNVFFVNHFKKMGSTICLGPDGNKPYYQNVKLSLRSRLKATVNTYRYLNNRKLYYTKPYFLSWKYGGLKQIDEFWVTYPEKFLFARGRKVIGFKVMPNANVVQQIADLFKFEISDILRHTQNIIFYTNNILYQKNAYDTEIKAIKLILERFPKTPFYLKYHPMTPEFQTNRFKELGVISFSNSIPAELYIASLKNSIIIGFWSTSLTVQNPSCKFYWLHKYLIKSGNMIERIKLINPTDYIQDVDDIDKITF